MNRRISLLSAAIGASLVLAALPAFSAELRTAKKPVPGQYIVVLKDGTASLAGERSSAARVSTVATDMASKPSRPRQAQLRARAARLRGRSR